LKALAYFRYWMNNRPVRLATGTAGYNPKRTCGAQDLERSIDVSLSADLDGYELDCGDPVTINL
jgi:hypothetical protein